MLEGFEITLIFKVIIFFFLFLGNTYAAVSNNHIYLRVELSTEDKENSDQLMKVYCMFNI